MSIKVAAWNLKNGLGDETRSGQIVEEIKKLDADIVVLPEASQEEDLQDVVDELRQEFTENNGYVVDDGYMVGAALYEDKDRRLDRHGMIVLNRLFIGSCVVEESLGDRNGMYVETSDPDTSTPFTFHAFGVHFDDRSEASRLQQAQATDFFLRRFDGTPRIIAGDFNSMPRQAIRSGVGRVARLLPARYPTTERPHISPIKRGANVLHRFGAMASGGTLQMLEAVGFEDADPDHQPTWPNAHPRFQLDHIMVSGEAHAFPFQVHDRSDGLSDHRAISATIET
ncbi:MAG TPA: endonuclease/exonuclease/phosphatase family protein [Candidatus Saccharimonadales bacterium]|nr:endonuclease/exonuclease/phosphatase family protein [Candidatus Saccharimonadales bacterium]